MDTRSERKKAIQAYKESATVGGIYRFANPARGWQSPLAATPNLKGQENHLVFAQKTGSCTDSMLAKKWKEYGAEGFVFEVVETLEQKPEQTTAEFREELAALLELWQEKEANGEK